MRRPINILVECPELTASVKIGVLEPLRPLEDQGKCRIRFQMTERISKKDILWCDVFVSVRGSEPVTLHIVQAAKQAGRFIVYYLDDDLLQVPKDTESGAYFQDRILKDTIIRIIRESDVLWGVNTLLLNKYQKYGGSRLVTNHVPAKIVSVVRKPSSKIKILYAGSVDHSAIVQAYLSPAIRRLCSNYKDLLDITFIGADPKLNDLPNVSWYPYIKDYDTYKRIVMEGGFQIGLAVIGTTDFYRYKYYNKFIEYTSIGAVGIYTDSEPYTLIVKNRENGILSKNFVEDWYKEIETLIREPILRHNCINNAQKLIQEKFNPLEVARMLENDLPELVNFQSVYVEKNEISLNCVWWRFYWGRTTLLWRVLGWRSLPVITFRSVRKIVKLLFR